MLAGGRVGDRLLRRGRPNGRVIAAITAYFAAAALLVPGVLTTALAVALPLYTVAAGCLGAANPPLDAARLDIMPAGLWGRAEAVRTVLRSGADASAPLLFGFTADRLAGGGPAGLEYTFLLMLAPMVLGGIIGTRALRTYPRDVATAAASDAGARRARKTGSASPTADRGDDTRVGLGLK